MNSSFQFLPPLRFETAAWLVASALAAWLVLRLMAGPPAANSRRRGLYFVRGALLATLLALLLNPVRVQEQPGAIDPPDVYYLLDASTSMALGTAKSRWDEVTGIIREAHRKAGNGARARLNLLRFGQRLAAIELSQIGLDLPDGSPARGATATDQKGSPPVPARPTDADTLLAGGLRQLSSRFGRSLPASIVLFSDGQARDAAEVEKIAGHFGRLPVPIHVVPVGDTSKGGDVAIVGVVAPDRVRRFTQVDVQVFLRSFGYEGRNARLVLSALTIDGKPDYEITSTPITLGKGIQSLPLVFQSDPKMRKLRVSIAAQESEISLENNKFDFEIGIDRTKIRVLYVEGNVAGLEQTPRNARIAQRGPHSDLQKALIEDPDIECVVLLAFPGATELRRTESTNLSVPDRGFPDTVAELSAYDCVIFSNVPRAAFTDTQLDWVENWVAHRGGGFCMAGGPFSFASGHWGGSVVENMLPVELRPGQDDFEPAGRLVVEPSPATAAHPVWRLSADEKQNRDVVRGFPAFAAGNRLAGAKPSLSTVLARAPRPQGEELPVITLGPYGKGRSMALAAGITEPWSGEFTRWGQKDHRYYAKFWRNAVYWLTESSSIGRRRLVASTDKKFYRPGETISLAALAYDEAANRTRAYRVVATIEPVGASSSLVSDYAPVRWPDGLQRTSGEEGPFVAWGEEIELPKGAGKEGYDMQFPIGEALPVATQGLRIELTAYEDSTQVDSTSLKIQTIDDPFELQNPFPNHELLARVAAVSGGKVLTSADALARTLEAIPIKIGAPEIRQTPLWSRWPLLALLVGLLTVEWIWRRSVGLA